MPDRNISSISDHPYGEHMRVAVNCLRHVRKRVLEMVKDGTAFDHPLYTAEDGTQKTMLQADKQAENEAIRYLTKYLGEEAIAVLGEETLWKYPNLDLTKQRKEGSGANARIVPKGEKRITAIVDMIDGSDLVERNLRNWCSAMVFLKPGTSPEILFSLIHNDNGNIYGADANGFFVLGRDTANSLNTEKGRCPEEMLLVSSKGKTLPQETAQIAICYYGQKSSHFTTLPSGLFTWAESHPAQDRFRFYNLAGNPMMARLANGEKIHGVFEHIGQMAHDAVPGLFIALKSGATVLDLSGQKITAEMLTTHLLQPSLSRLKYVVGSTYEIAAELAKAVGSSAQTH